MQGEDISVERAFVLTHICFAFKCASRWWISWYIFNALGIEEWFSALLKFTAEGLVAKLCARHLSRFPLVQ